LITEYKPFVNADYLAGLFDGEGSVSLSITRNGVTIQISITNNSGIIIESVTKYLQSQNIVVVFRTVFNHWGYCRRLVASGGEARRIAELLLPHAIGKHRQLEIVLELFTLKKRLQENGERVRDHLLEFDAFRQELHSLAIKGPRTLKPISHFFTTTPEKASTVGLSQ
jgi:hypothetical protein